MIYAMYVSYISMAQPLSSMNAFPFQIFRLSDCVLSESKTIAVAWHHHPLLLSETSVKYCILLSCTSQELIQGCVAFCVLQEVTD